MTTNATQIHDLTVAQLAAKLRAKDVSAVEITQHFLARSHAADHLGAYLAFNDEFSLSQANLADERLAKGDSSALLGVPIAHKDIFVTKDFPSTAGSKMLGGYYSSFDSTVVNKFAGSGMISLGKLNCDEFAMGSGNENSAYKKVLNPWDHSRIPGGSSGGSAAAIDARCDWHRHRRLHPPASRVLRHHWHQTHLRPRLALRHGRLCVQPRPSRPDGAHC
jgi:aspartyl-tRNA(Asn)/glutamyl-tRNA(Gln) amidotransferase subunit A